MNTKNLKMLIEDLDKYGDITTEVNGESVILSSEELALGKHVNAYINHTEFLGAIKYGDLDNLDYFDNTMSYLYGVPRLVKVSDMTKEQRERQKRNLPKVLSDMIKRREENEIERQKKEEKEKEEYKEFLGGIRIVR